MTLPILMPKALAIFWANTLLWVQVNILAGVLALDMFNLLFRNDLKSVFLNEVQIYEFISTAKA